MLTPGASASTVGDERSTVLMIRLMAPFRKEDAANQKVETEEPSGCVGPEGSLQCLRSGGQFRETFMTTLAPLTVIHHLPMARLPTRLSL